MNEKDFGAKTRRLLSWGLIHIETEKLARLRTGRARAMEAYEVPSPAMELVASLGAGRLARLPLARKPIIWLPTLILLVALAGILLRPEAEPDLGELDAALLTGELPINAFLDQDFDAWLKNNE